MLEEGEVVWKQNSRIIKLFYVNWLIKPNAKQILIKQNRCFWQANKEIPSIKLVLDLISSQKGLCNYNSDPFLSPVQETYVKRLRAMCFYQKEKVTWQSSRDGLQGISNCPHFYSRTFSKAYTTFLTITISSTKRRQTYTLVNRPLYF